MLLKKNQGLDKNIIKDKHNRSEKFSLCKFDTIWIYSDEILALVWKALRGTLSIFLLSLKITQNT